MNKPVEIKEFDSIISNKDYADVENYTSIAKKDLDFIKEYACTEENADVLDFMSIGRKPGVGDIVTFKNYVGLIQMKTGFQIQVLPKIDFDNEADTGNEFTKKIFLKMLWSMKDFPSKVFNDASLKVDRMKPLRDFHKHVCSRGTSTCKTWFAFCLCRNGIQSKILQRKALGRKTHKS